MHVKVERIALLCRGLITILFVILCDEQMRAALSVPLVLGKMFEKLVHDSSRLGVFASLDDVEIKSPAFLDSTRSM